MKYLRMSIVMLLCIMSLVGCEKSEESERREEIFGTWKLSEVFIDIGNGSGEWSKVEDGYEYQFNRDNTFTTNRFADCQNGSYSLNTNELNLDFDCENITIGNELIGGSLVEGIEFGSDEFILKPTYVICVEACRWKFEKIE